MEKWDMHWIEKIVSPIIFGHRGASKYAPENTLAAFTLSLQQGAEAIELDTMLTADGIPVVIHDRTVDRTTNGTGKVDQLMVEQLRVFDAGTKFSPNFRGEKIPLLEEIFTLYKDKALINVELKNYHNPTDDLPEIVIKLAKKKNVNIGIDLDEILMADKKEKVKILSRLRQNIKLAKKNKLKIEFISKNKPDKRNLKSLGLLLGMPTNMTKEI